MEQIPTAEEMVDLWQKEVLENMGTEKANQRSLEETMIRFAKLHVEAALKAKVEQMKEKSYEDSSYSMNELDSFTRDSYPLENIK